MAQCRLLLVLCLLPSVIVAQTNRYMVFFNDKSGTPHTIGQPSTFLSDRALERRTKALVTIGSEDLPVTPSYVTQIRATGAKAFFTTRWMNGVLVEATPAMITTITAFPFVKSTEYVAPNAQLIGGRKGSHTQTGSTGSSTDGQLQMLGLDTMHLDGYRGEGVMVAVLDSGFPGVGSTAPFQDVRDGNQIKLTIDFITNSGDVYQFHDHGTNVFSTIAAQSSSFDGGAPKADYLLFVTEDVQSEYRVEEYNWLFAAEQADSAGADIIQSSLGYSDFDDPSMDYTTASLNGTTAVISRAAGFARDRGIIVVVSAANLGGTPWMFIAPPADADGILAVGAVTSAGSKAGFSSIGPSADGRIKPDVAALGVGVSTITASGTMAFTNGTSVASPLVTSLAAGLVQAYPNLRPDELVDAIKMSATQAASPDNMLGYGIPSYQGVRNYLKSSAFSVHAYPNPASATLWLSMRPPPEEPVTISIYDMLGKEMTSASLLLTWANNPLPIHVSELASGLYLLRVVSPEGINSFRFVKH